MSISKSPYFLPPALPEITRHDLLPSGCYEIAYLKDNTCSTHWYFINNNGFLSILNVASRTLNDGSHFYRCSNDDFPLEFLTWFPEVLTEFQKSPAEGGLHAGAMTTPDINVGGEMLCLQRAMGVDQDRGGYIVRNRCRCKKGYDPEVDFEPHDVCWASRFLYDGGLLNMIKDLGQKLVEGKI